MEKTITAVNVAHCIQIQTVTDSPNDTYIIRLPYRQQFEHVRCSYGEHNKKKSILQIESIHFYLFIYFRAPFKIKFLRVQKKQNCTPDRAAW